VALYDLRIGPASGAGIRVVNCLAPVVLDHCEVATTPAVDAVHIDASPQVAVQTCALSGGPGLRVSNGSVVYLSAGTLDALTVENSSRVKFAGITGFGLTIDGTSSAQRLDFTMPALAFDSLAGSEQAVPIGVIGDPNQLFAVQTAATKFFFDLTDLQIPIDMVLLLGINPNVGLGGGVLDANGVGVLPLQIPATPSLWGMSLPLQAMVLDPTTFTGRWTNVRDLVIVP
jgi:hypothetical protein